MKIKIITTVLIAFAMTSCTESKKKSPQTSGKEVQASTSVKPLLATAETPNEYINKVYYVTALSGLSLRAGSNLKSKKMLVLPYGAQLSFISSPPHTEMTVGGVEGKMLEVAYQGAQGFVFDGYLSTLSPPQEHEDLGSYAKRISTAEFPVTVEKASDKKGENYGMTTTLKLPAKNWQEMYKISQRLFNIPSNLRPNFDEQMKNEVLLNAKKRERTLTDELEVMVSKDQVLERLVYHYKLRDYSRTVTITKSDLGFEAVEVETSN